MNWNEHLEDRQREEVKEAIHQRALDDFRYSMQQIRSAPGDADFATRHSSILRLIEQAIRDTAAIASDAAVYAILEACEQGLLKYDPEVVERLLERVAVSIRENITERGVAERLFREAQDEADRIRRELQDEC